jgi:hypothetical protein
MTRSPEKGDSPITDDVRREARRTGKDPCTILKERRRVALSQRPVDKKLIGDLVKAEKYFGCRNLRKRRKRRGA